MKIATPPQLGFVAFSGTGKTTLLCKLIPLLRERDIRIGMIKHAHHTFDIDTPGKDSYELRKAGAQQMLVTSRQRWALITETPDRPPGPDGDPMLEDMLAQLDHSQLDIILVEGFKHVAFPKIELHRPSLGHPLLFPNDKDIIAVATDADLPQACSLPRLDLNNPAEVADFVINFIKVSAS